jgi:O-antigen ligase
MYALLSAFISFESCFSVSRKSSKVLWLCIGIILTLSQYFISSRVGILTSLVLIPAYFVYKIIKTGKYRLLIFVPLIFISTLPVILKNQRVDYLFGRVFNKQVGYIRKKDPRFLIWKSAMNVSKNNLMFGVGIGDVRTELFKEYEKTEEPYIIKEKYNAHNQFLETLVEDGIIGLMIFLVLIILMFYISYKERNLLYGIFIIISLAFFIFESVLYRFAGISFFSLFSFLLLHIKKKQCS